ncbi:MAG: PD-(D/E)XK nuclease family protein [Phycisphaerae bacterium]|nr:PD-(D/E)XK nuclease family protein [Phycisphaerae bacterium]
MCFVIGRAGAGKTRHCLSAVRERIVQSSLDGHRLALLVPEQASLQTERALLALPELKVTHRAEVLSFRRIALRICGQSAPDARITLSANSRTMILRYLLSKLSPELQYFKNAERFPGFLDRLSRTIDELLNEAITSNEIDQALQTPDQDPLRQHKMRDLQRIFAAYLDYLGTQRLDPSQYLEVARAHIPQCEWLNGAEFWVDGFSGFTRQERLTLVALARADARLEVTLLMDPGHARLTDLTSLDASDLFAKTARTYVELQRSFRKDGIEIEAPVVLDPPTLPRFQAAPQLATLERTLFQATPPPSESAKPAEPAVRVFEASNRRIEVDYVVAGIAHLVQTDSDRLRYRDIGITVRDLQPYHDLLASALEARGIPYFIDRRRPTSHHPLVEWLRSFVQLPLDGMSPDTVRLLLKTGLLPVDRDDCDLVENHLIATELSGLDSWSKPWKVGLGRWNEGETPERQRAVDQRLERLNRTRQRLLGVFKPWVDFAFAGQTRTSLEWAEALTGQLESLGIVASMGQWAEAAEADGELDRAEEHRQILRDLGKLLDELAAVLPDEPLTLRQLAQMLDSALAQFSLGLAPPTLDQVLVTGIERSRNPDLKVFFVLGFNDGMFPAVPVEDAILNDDDRVWLEANGLQLAPSTKALLLEERFLAYVAFTRPSRKLIVSYAVATEDGKELRRSPYLEDLTTACPDAGRHRVDDPFVHRAAWGVRNRLDLATHLAYELGSRPPLEHDRSNQRKLWNALYQRAHLDAVMSGPLRRALAALVYENRAALGSDSVASLYPETLHTSVSRLETYAACPFKHFAEWNLKLEPRRCVRMQPVDIGKVHHAVLELFVKQLLAEDRSIVGLDDDELARRLEEAVRLVARELPEAGAASLARDQYVLRHTRSQLERVLRMQQAIYALGAFRPFGAERSFGFEADDSLPSPVIDTPAGRQVLLRGVIDRVDLAEVDEGMLGVVIDYKRTPGKRLDLCSAYHGLSLQLLAYLLVLRQHGEAMVWQPIVPAGALYVPLVESYQKVDHPDDTKVSEQLPTTGAPLPRGLLNLEYVDVLDRSFAETRRSEVYQVALKKDGTLGYVDRSDAAEADDFARVLEQTARRIGEHADGILDGTAAVQPYRLGTFSPCSWCEQQPVCRFEFPTARVRNLEPLKRSEVFRRLGGEMENGKWKMENGE